MLKSDNSKPFRLSALAVALAMLPLGAHAAGFGRLTVTSALGQPLRAQIEVTASREELSSLSARMASGAAFKEAGIEYTPALSALRFSIEKRPSGQAFIVVGSDRPFNEPFVDMLVQMDWASGRLVREYTFLLDPPDVVKKAETPAAVPLPEVKKEAPAATAPEPAPAPAPAAAAPAEKPAAQAPVKPTAKATAAGTTRQVVKGDTLAKIASETKPSDVSLDQMLAALFLNNKEAFDGGNMNRLRAGKILTIPDAKAVAEVAPAEAHKMVVAQASDFNAYRRKLAAAAAAEPAKEEAPKQAATGKIAPKVEEKAPPVPAGKDKLEVSRTEAAKGGGKSAARIGQVEEDLIARDKELKEANSRIAALEKNLAELKRLADMKAAAGAKPAEAPAKPAEAAKPPVPPAAPVPPALTVPAKPVEPVKPAEAPKAAEAPKPAEAEKPAAPPKPKAPPQPVEPPPPPPSFVDENPEIVFGGAAVLAALAGYFGYSAWRRKREAAEPDTGASEMAPSSVFGTAGGQSVDTGASLPTDFSQQPVDSGDEGVDPVAEADVYIAYGRDKQAEEILLEALKTDPTRAAIHVKLLEIYAARKDTSSFESVARELYGLTGGAGHDWERAQLLGRSIDPNNPLYGAPVAAAAPAAAPAPAPAAAQPKAEAAPALDMTSTVVTSARAMQAPAAERPAAPAPQPTAAPAAAPAEELPASLDFDLDLSAPTPEAAAPAEAPKSEEPISLDFDLGMAAPAPEAAAAPAAAPSIDFELGTPEPAKTVEAPPAAPEAGGLDFDFDLSEPAAPAAPAPAAPVADIPLPVEPAKPTAAASLDLAGISLDLDEVPAAAAVPETTALIDDPEVATKLELAQAYEEMGDKEGARELLNEVLNEGSPAQQDAAKQKLAALA
ncbi:MAG TPA: FimV/HubP family polar landmark protein [Rhodocyclaceae bacterium]